MSDGLGMRISTHKALGNEEGAPNSDYCGSWVGQAVEVDGSVGPPRGVMGVTQRIGDGRWAVGWNGTRREKDARRVVLYLHSHYILSGCGVLMIVEDG